MQRTCDVSTLPMKKLNGLRAKSPTFDSMTSDVRASARDDVTVMKAAERLTELSVSPSQHYKLVTSPAVSSPRPVRRRANTMDNPSAFCKRLNTSTRATCTLNPTHPPSGMKTPPLNHIPKDPIQPKHGSIQNIHSESGVLFNGVAIERKRSTHAQPQQSELKAAEEEEDVFVELPSHFRQRSNTCPESLSRARKAKIRSLRRPPTPPPADLKLNDSIDNHFDPCHTPSTPPRLHSSIDDCIQEEIETPPVTSQLTPSLTEATSSDSCTRTSTRTLEDE